MIEVCGEAYDLHAESDCVICIMRGALEVYCIDLVRLLANSEPRCTRSSKEEHTTLDDNVVTRAKVVGY